MSIGQRVKNGREHEIMGERKVELSKIEKGFLTLT